MKNHLVCKMSGNREKEIVTIFSQQSKTSKYSDNRNQPMDFGMFA